VDLLPRCPVARAAFVAYRGAAGLSRLVLELWEAVQLFVEVYRSLGGRLAESALAPGAALGSLPKLKSHAAGAELVFGETGRVVFLDGLQRVAHRHALLAGIWELETRSWRALGRCGRDRGRRHDQRKVLDRPLTPFRLFARYAACSLCPTCGLRNFVRPFGWRVGKKSGDDRAFVEESPSTGVVHACRTHGAKQRYEYAVPDLLAESPVPGSSRLRWRYWPRWNEARGVFEELVTEENRLWPTFLDFEYSERRAMQCIALFCDSREDWLRCVLVLVGCRLFSVDPVSLLAPHPFVVLFGDRFRCPEVVLEFLLCACLVLALALALALSFVRPPLVWSSLSNVRHFLLPYLADLLFPNLSDFRFV
jgi:hypothetical protein